MEEKGRLKMMSFKSDDCRKLTQTVRRELDLILT